MSEERTLKDLVDEALTNARDDRDKAIKAFDDTKGALSDPDPNKAMLVGPLAIKALEALTRANEQLVRLAQILQRKEEKVVTANEGAPLISSKDLEKYMAEQNAEKK